MDAAAIVNASHCIGRRCSFANRTPRTTVTIGLMKYPSEASTHVPVIHTTDDQSRRSREVALRLRRHSRRDRRPRAAALSPEFEASPLAKRPYDLRHACLSTWLNAGVPPAQVAEWAGHSVNVLLRVYAKCIDGQDEMAKRLIEAALLDRE